MLVETVGKKEGGFLNHGKIAFYSLSIIFYFTQIIFMLKCNSSIVFSVLVKISGHKMKHSFLFILVTMGVVACVPGDDAAPVEANLRTLQQHELQTVDASTAFAMDLYQQLRKTDSPNRFFSPYSIHVALSMAMAGNEGEALEEYLEVLRFGDQTVEEANKGAKELTEFLLQVDPKVKTHIANSMWYRQDYLVKSTFRQVLEDYYKAEVAGIDVLDPKSVDIINGWIERNTEGLIKDMLDEIPPNAVMYLVNAIYYKADWKYRFDAGKTKTEPFYITPDRPVEVDMMSLGEAAAMKFYGGNDYSYLEIPYSTGQYSMGVILPNGHNIEEIEEEITLENLNLWRNQARETNLLLKMPKFKLKDKRKNMAKDLMDMGLRIPFVFDARNFTLLFDNPTDLLKISGVTHDAVIEVDEKGSEAAAATVVGVVELVSTGPSKPPVFTLDRPFIFFIQEKHSGAVLFMGKLGDPSLL